MPVKSSSLKGRRASLNPQAEIIDPEHEEQETQSKARAQAEEAVTAAKLAEAERAFIEKAEKLVSAHLVAWKSAQRNISYFLMYSRLHMHVYMYVCMYVCIHICILYVHM